MGRRAKYFTLTEKHQADRQRKMLSGQTEHTRALRRQQNRRAYLQRCSSSKPQPEETFILPTLPKKLRGHAVLIIPTSRIFKTVRQFSDFYTDTEYDDLHLVKWDGPPPYPTSSPQDNQLVDAILGRRIRLQHEFENARIRRYDTLPTLDFKKEVYTDVCTELGRWEDIGHALADPALGVISRRFGKLWQRWLAKRVIDLCEDFCAMEKGNDAFISVYLKRWT